MVYLLKMVIFHGYVSHNQMVIIRSFFERHNAKSGGVYVEFSGWIAAWNMSLFRVFGRTTH